MQSLNKIHLPDCASPTHPCWACRRWRRLGIAWDAATVAPGFPENAQMRMMKVLWFATRCLDFGDLSIDKNVQKSKIHGVIIKISDFWVVLQERDLNFSLGKSQVWSKINNCKTPWLCFFGAPMCNQQSTRGWPNSKFYNQYNVSTVFSLKG